MARRWEDDWQEYARVAKALFLALEARAARARARGMPDAWRSFLGSDAVSWLVNARHVRARGDAVALGRALVRDALLVHAGERRPFEDDRLSVYRFQVDNANDVIYRLGVLHAPARRSPYDLRGNHRTPCPQPHYQHIEQQQLQRRDSDDSLLAFSEASVELNDKELLNGDWGEKVRPLNAAHPTHTEAEPGAFRLDAALCATEFDEPQVAYKVLSIMSFEKNPSDPSRRSSRGRGVVDASLDPNAPDHKGPSFANLPAFRQKLTTALADPPADHHQDHLPVFANAAAFRQKLSAAFSNNHTTFSNNPNPQPDHPPPFANPPAYRYRWAPAPSHRDPDPDPEQIMEPQSDPLDDQPLSCEPSTPDRTRSAHSGRWGPRSGLRGMAWPIFSRTSRLFRGRRNLARSESGMSRYR